MQWPTPTPIHGDTLTREQFITIVEENSSNLTHYAYTRTGNLETAREIVQEVFLRLARTDFRKVADHVRPWLYCVCRNLSSDSRQKQSRCELLPTEIIDHRHSSHDPDAVDQSIHGETRGLLVRFVSELPAREQEVLLLKFRNGLKYHEIAKILSLTPGHVGYILHHTIALLRDRLT
jgi:RNA polymerase sigma factor (sigma-70 family)